MVRGDWERTNFVQYYEMLGHRAIWKGGWKAVMRHRQGKPFSEDKWLLYDTKRDFAECHDLAPSEPEKLKEMVAAWWAEAGHYNVLPLDDRGIELFTLRLPDAAGPRLAYRYLPGTPHIDRFAVPDIRNRSFTIRARVIRASGAEEGVLVACGARTGGHCLFIQMKRVVFAYNRIGHITRLTSSIELPAGECEVAVVFRKTAPNEGVATLEVDGTSAGEAPITLLPFRQTVAGLDVGADHGSTVCGDYAAPFRFSGRLHHVDYALGTDRDDFKRAAAVEARNALTDQ